MIILGIESAALTASTAIVTDGILTAEYTVNHKKTHSQTLLPMLDEICRMAEESKDFPSLVDVQDNCFLSPDSMCESIRTWCEAHSLKVPQTLGEIASVVYRSLAACYAQTAKELETLNGKPYPVVQVVGGGSQAEYLNQLTADALGKTVYAGPTEASAIGNIIVQMWGRGGIGSLDEARQIVGASFPVKVFQPRS